MYGYVSCFCTHPRTGVDLTYKNVACWIADNKEGVKLFGGASLLVMIPLLLWYIPAVQRQIQEIHSLCHGAWAPLWFMMIAIPYCAVGLSRQALCWVAGAGFGVIEGILWCSLAYEGGALLGYVAGRCFKRSKKIISSDTKHSIRDLVKEAPFQAILGLRLMPVGSSLLVSVASGMLHVPLAAFAWATAIGGVPQNIVFVLAGSGVHMGHGIEILLAGGLFVCSALLGICLVKRYRVLKKH